MAFSQFLASFNNAKSSWEAVAAVAPPAADALLPSTAVRQPLPEPAQAEAKSIEDLRSIQVRGSPEEDRKKLSDAFNAKPAEEKPKEEASEKKAKRRWCHGFWVVLAVAIAALIPLLLSLSQQPAYSQNPDKAPDTNFTGKGNHSEESGGIVAILDMISLEKITAHLRDKMADADKLRDQKEADKDAQADIKKSLKTDDNWIRAVGRFTARMLR